MSPIKSKLIDMLSGERQLLLLKEPQLEFYLPCTKKKKRSFSCKSCPVDEISQQRIVPSRTLVLLALGIIALGTKGK